MSHFFVLFAFQSSEFSARTYVSAIVFFFNSDQRPQHLKTVHLIVQLSVFHLVFFAKVFQFDLFFKSKIPSHGHFRWKCEFCIPTPPLHSHSSGPWNICNHRASVPPTHADPVFLFFKTPLAWFFSYEILFWIFSLLTTPSQHARSALSFIAPGQLPPLPWGERREEWGGERGLYI